MNIYLQSEGHLNDEFVLVNKDGEVIFFIEANYSDGENINSWTGQNNFGIGTWTHEKIRDVLRDIEDSYKDKVIGKRILKGIK